MRRPWTLVVALVIAAPAASARADGRALTLDEALALAAKHNPSVQSARAAVDAAAAAVSLARGSLLPIVAAQGKYTHNYTEVDFDLGGGQSAALVKQEQHDATLT